MTTPIMIQCGVYAIDIRENSKKSGALLDAFPQEVWPSLDGPATFAANQTWEILPDPAGSSHFIIQNPATKHCIDIQENSIDAGASLDAYLSKHSHNQNQLWDFLPDPFGSGNFFIQNPQTGHVIEIKAPNAPLSNAPFPLSNASLVVNPRRLFDNGLQLWAGVEEDWTPATFPALTLAPVPTKVTLTNFGSNNQYVLLAPNQSTNLKSATVTIDIIEDLIADSFSIQINGNAPTPADGSGARWDAQWVQFALLMQNNGLYLWNQAWHARGADQQGDPLASDPVTSAPMLTTLQNNTVPAGTRIVLTLTIDRSENDFVTAVSGQVFDNGVPIGNPISLSLIGQSTFNPGGPVQESDLAPWGALSVAVVGAPGGNTNFTSGMGTITVGCDPEVKVSLQLNGPNPHGITTGEKSNCYYGQVQQGSFKQIVQPFGVPTPKITGYDGTYVSGGGLYPNSNLTVSAKFILDNELDTIEGVIHFLSPSQADGSFTFGVEAQNTIAYYNAGTLSVKVTDSGGNSAWADFLTGSGSPQLSRTGGTPRTYW
jgi:hypothetical protein